MNARLELGDNVTMSAITDFIKDFKKLFNHGAKAAKLGLYIQLEVITFIMDKKMNNRVSDYNRWYCKGDDTYFDDEGGFFYLSADTEYTDSRRDICLTKDILSSLDNK